MNIKEIEQYVISKEQHEIANVLDVVLPKIAKEHELLGLYRLLIDLKEEYQVSDDILKKQKTLDSIRDVIEEINLLVEEIEERNGKFFK